MAAYYTDVSIRGNYIYYRGRDNGRRVQKRVEYKPYMFIPSRNKDSQYRSLFGQSLDKLELDSIRGARDFVKKYEDVDGFEVFGLDRYIYTYLNDRFPNEINYDPNEINTVAIDIEVDSSDGFPNIERADREITAISMKRRNTVMAFGCGDYEPAEGVLYVKCKDEKSLLYKFLDLWNQWDVDIVTGWHIELFDIPYIVNRVKVVLGEEAIKKLSPWEIIEEDTIFQNNKEQKTYKIKGVCILDYEQLYRKFTYTNQESYKLDHIAFVELGERKLDYSEYEGLHDLYQRNFQKFMEYNVHDVLLIDRLEKKMGLISLALTVAYDAKINYSDVFTSVRLWDVIIHNHLFKKNIIISKNKVTKKYDQFAGAYVKDPIVGMHKHTASFDVESLYPSLIVQYNISPETFRGRIHNMPSVDSLVRGDFDNTTIQQKCIEENVAITANGCLWDKDIKGIFPELVEKMMSERKMYKRMMLDAQKEYQENPSVDLENKISKYNNLQMARKIQLNSLYGALGNQYFRWFQIEFAEAITLTGQLAIRWTERHINTFLNKTLNTTNIDRVIAIDTDSVYLNLNDLVKSMIKNYTTEKAIDFMDKACGTVIQEVINKSFNDLVQYTNAYTPFLKMKREALADKGIWTAKKRYILNVYDNEGVRYKEPKLKMMGIEAVKSSTPSSCREKIKDTLKIIMKGTEEDVIKTIEEFRSEFKKLPFEEIAFPRGCNNLTEYKDKDLIYKKGTPIHVRGALVFNNLLQSKQLENRIELVKEGEKIKFCYLKLPNPLRENVISVVNTLPRQLDLDKYIDYELQFTKAYLEPIKSILDVIGYSTEKRATLSDFFG